MGSDVCVFMADALLEFWENESYLSSVTTYGKCAS